MMKDARRTCLIRVHVLEEQIVIDLQPRPKFSGLILLGSPKDAFCSEESIMHVSSVSFLFRLATGNCTRASWLPV